MARSFIEDFFSYYFSLVGLWCSNEVASLDFRDNFERNIILFSCVCFESERPLKIGNSKLVLLAAIFLFEDLNFLTFATIFSLLIKSASDIFGARSCDLLLVENSPFSVISVGLRTGTKYFFFA